MGGSCFRALPAAFFFLLAFSSCSQAYVGRHSCPPDYGEDISCKMSCCSSYGGNYSVSGGSCTVASGADWSSVTLCEKKSGCCVRSPSPISPACWAGLFVMGAVMIGAFIASGRK